MRKLALMMLGLSFATSLAAQDAEIIIRRPGQQDQIIKLDSAQGREAMAKAEAELRSASRALQLRLSDVQRKMAPSRARLLDSTMLNKELKAYSLKPGDLSKMTLFNNGKLFNFAMRPLLGITVAIDARESDKFGAYVTAVTPGGPADKAGIRSGDIITKIDGKSMTATDDVKGDKGESLPGLRLVDVAGKLESGKAVDVDYRRDNSNHTVKVTPTEDNSMAFTRFMPFTEPSRIGGRMMADSLVQIYRGGAEGALALPRGGYAYSFSTGGPLGDLELASLNEKLGGYFGTSEGVLVINTGTKDAFGLLPGDVVVSVDSRKVTSPGQLMRVLRTYDKGDEFKLQILRQKKAETLSGKLP